jgi:hypothetical protein
MRGKLVAALALLVGSEVIGIILGQWFFSIFQKTVPPAILTEFNRATAHAAFLTYGVGAGAIIWVWALAALGIAAAAARWGSPKTSE